MTSQQQFFLLLLAAWSVLLFVTAAIQRERVQRRVCLVGGAGLALLAANIAVADVAVHFIVRAAAYVLLIWAAWTAIRVRQARGQ